MDWWGLWYNNNIQEFLETTYFSVPLLIKIYSENNHDFLPRLIALNALRIGIPISITEAKESATLRTGAEHETYTLTLKQATAIAKNFATVLKEHGLSDSIPQSYVSKKALFDPISTPEISPPHVGTLAKTTLRLKQTHPSVTEPTTIISSTKQQTPTPEPVTALIRSRTACGLMIPPGEEEKMSMEMKVDTVTGHSLIIFTKRC